ncbi:hypothetical protein PFISCL1PPCAC_25399, partial [Pristionchus fissidentatus]
QLKMPLRPASSEDVPELYAMLLELAAFEKMDSGVKITQEQFADDFNQGRFSALIVVDEESDKAAAMVLYHVHYNTWHGQIMSMDELLVRPEYRRKKYGKLLLAAVAKEAKKLKVANIEWTVLNWNEPAIRFYKSVKGVSDLSGSEGWLRYRMDGEGIADLAGSE